MPAITSTAQTAGTDARASAYNTLRLELLSARPIGEIMLWGTNTPPDDYLFCQGQAVSRSTYAALFAVIGTTFGIGDGSTTFNLPDAQGKVIVGRKSTDTDFDNLGDTGGEKTHVLLESEMPVHTHATSEGAHTHTITDPGHTHSVNDPAHSHGLNDPGHSHRLRVLANKNYTGSGLNPHDPSGSFTGSASDRTESTTTGATVTGNTTGIYLSAAGTGVTTVGATTGLSIISAGASGAHNNMQPFVVLNYMIRYQ